MVFLSSRRLIRTTSNNTALVCAIQCSTSLSSSLFTHKQPGELRPPNTQFWQDHSPRAPLTCRRPSLAKLSAYKAPGYWVADAHPPLNTRSRVPNSAFTFRWAYRRPRFESLTKALQTTRSAHCCWAPFALGNFNCGCVVSRKRDLNFEHTRWYYFKVGLLYTHFYKALYFVVNFIFKPNNKSFFHFIIV